MDDKRKRRDATRAYKERQEVGGIFRYVDEKNGWQSPLMATVNLQGQRNRFQFGKDTGACFHAALESHWAAYGCKTIEFVEVERLERKPEHSAEEFKEELGALLAMYEGE